MPKCVFWDNDKDEIAGALCLSIRILVLDMSGKKGGGLSMEQEPLQLQKAYKDILLSCTDKMAGLSLQETEQFPKEGKAVFLGSVVTSGDCPFEIRCVVEQPVYKRIINGMTKGKKLGEDMQRLYFAEYMNVVCGKIISRRNNAKGEFLRISVPVVSYEDSYIERQKEQMPTFQFICEDGWMGVYFLRD